LVSGASYNGGWTASQLTSDGTFVKAYIVLGTDNSQVAVLPSDESKFQQRANGTKMNGLLTGAETKSAAVYTINGVRCPAGSKLPNGLYVVREPGNNAVTGLMMR
jgi:hypothetical protein